MAALGDKVIKREEKERKVEKEKDGDDLLELLNQEELLHQELHVLGGPSGEVPSFSLPDKELLTLDRYVGEKDFQPLRNSDYALEPDQAVAEYPSLPSQTIAERGDFSFSITTGGYHKQVGKIEDGKYRHLVSEALEKASLIRQAELFIFYQAGGTRTWRQL
ncbi:MAG TPA: hypothetical protein VJI15_00210 [Candidatus Nanoarchaeia archaeon]|nr:hypothetical protein [Candidatus Nanoarchaeia archaeon]